MSDGASERDGAGISQREQALLREIEELRARVKELESRDAGGSAAPRVRPPTAPPTAPPILPPVPGLPARREFSLEQFVGRRVVPLVGGVAVLGAVGFLVHYAYELGLLGRIGPEARFAIGAAIGLALLGAGEWVRRRGAPGAAIGLDAAGVGAVMVSVALGVFSLRIFGPAQGAVIAAAAGLLGALWSVRSGSVTVAIVALLGGVAMPPGVGLARENPRAAALLVLLSCVLGLGTHVLGGAAFAAVRFTAIGAAVLAGAPAIAGIASPVEALSIAIVWWGFVVGQAALLALRGREVRGNAIAVALASAVLPLLELNAGWSAAGGIGAIESLPCVAGALLAGVAFWLRGFALAEDGGTRVWDEDRAALAVGVACSALSRTSVAVALALASCGAAFLVPFEASAAVLGCAAGIAAWCSRRHRGSPFDAVAALLAMACGITAVATLVTLRGSPSVTEWRCSLPFAFREQFEVRFGAPVLFMLGAALAQFVAIGSVRLRAAAVTMAVWVMIAAAVAAQGITPTVLACALFAVPGIVVGSVATMRLRLVVVALVLASFGAVGWAGFCFDQHWGRGRADLAEIVWIFLPIAGSLIMLTRHRALGAMREAALRAGVCAVAAGFALIAAVIGESRAGGMEPLFAIVAALSVFALCALGLARLASSRVLAESGVWIAGAAVAFITVLGVLRLFETGGSPEDGVAVELAAVVAVAAAVAAVVPLSRGETGVLRRAGGALLACALAPVVVISLGLVFGRPLASGAAVGCIVLVGVGELVVGFRRDIAALRWAGLWSFALLVLRLYLVDLAQSPMLVRIALLFVSGFVLVGTGIAYARMARRPG